MPGIKVDLEYKNNSDGSPKRLVQRLILFWVGQGGIFIRFHWNTGFMGAGILGICLELSQHLVF